MYCKNCGTQLPDDASFCRNCGSKTYENFNTANGTYYTPPNNNEQNFTGQDFGGANPNGDFQYDPNFTEKSRIIEKGDQAETLGVVGIIIGVVFWSVIGIVLGAIGCRYASDAYNLTGLPSYSTAKSVSKWAIIIGVLKIVAEIAIIFCMFGFMAAFDDFG